MSPFIKIKTYIHIHSKLAHIHLTYQVYLSLGKYQLPPHTSVIFIINCQVFKAVGSAERRTVCEEDDLYSNLHNNTRIAEDCWRPSHPSPKVTKFVLGKASWKVEYEPDDDKIIKKKKSALDVEVVKIISCLRLLENNNLRFVVGKFDIYSNASCHPS